VRSFAFEGAVEAIGKVQPKINACVTEPWEKPLGYESSGPFAGVPFALKDLMLCSTTTRT
jgi:amidase